MVDRYEMVSICDADGNKKPEMWIENTGSLVYHEDYEKLQKERDRLLVLATKHCDKSHHDWDEILKIANDGEG